MLGQQRDHAQQNPHSAFQEARQLWLQVVSAPCQVSPLESQLSKQHVEAGLCFLPPKTYLNGSFADPWQDCCSS